MGDEAWPVGSRYLSVAQLGAAWRAAATVAVRVSPVASLAKFDQAHLTDRGCGLGVAFPWRLFRLPPPANFAVKGWWWCTLIRGLSP